MPKRKKRAPSADLAAALLGDDTARVGETLAEMKTGGVPAGALEELLLLMQDSQRPARLRNQAKLLFQKEAPEELQAAIKSVFARTSVYSAGETKLKKRLRALQGASSSFDVIKLALILLRSRGQALKYLLSLKDDELTLEALRILRQGAKLDLSGKELSSVPAELGRMEGLEELNLCANHLSRVPDSLSTMTGLVALNLAHNRLSKVPEAVLAMSALQELDLSSNQINKVPSGLAGLKKLRRLGLGDNRFETFPPELLRLRGLRALDLSTEPYGSSYPLNELPEEIVQLGALQELSLSAHHFSRLPESLQKMKLERIDLHHCSLAEVPSWLAELPKLRKIDLRWMETDQTDRLRDVVHRLRERGVELEVDGCRRLEVLLASRPATGARSEPVLPPGAMEVPPNEELERRILEAPDEDEAYLVYGDWLQEQGHPWGELMMLQHARLRSPGDALLKAEESRVLGVIRGQLLGQLSEKLSAFALKWHLGVIRSVRMHKSRLLPAAWSASEALGALLRHPAARFIRRLALGEFSWGADDPDGPQVFLDTLDSIPPLRACESLFVDRLSRAADSKLEGVKGLPALRSLTLAGLTTVGGTGMDQLRRLSLGTTQVVHAAQRDALATNLQAAIDGRFSDLRQLEVWWDPPRDEAAELLAALLQAKLALRGLRLRHVYGSIQQLCEALPRAPFASSLEVLELSYGGMTDAEARALARESKAFGALRSINVEGCRLTKRGVAALRKIATEVHAGEQQQGELIWSYTSDEKEPSYLRQQSLCLGQGDADLAARARAVLEESSDAGRVIYNTGTFRLMDGDTEGALPLLRAAVEIPHPDARHRAWSNVAIVHANLGQFETAVELSRLALLDDPKEPNFWAILIDALRHLRLLDQAVEAVEQGSKFVSGSNEGMALLQDCMLTLLFVDRAAEAMELYDRFAKRGRPRKQLVACAVIVAAHVPDLRRASTLARGLTDCDDPIKHHAQACLHALKGEEDEVRRELEAARDSGYAEWRYMSEEDALLHDRYG